MTGVTEVVAAGLVVTGVALALLLEAGILAGGVHRAQASALLLVTCSMVSWAILSALGLPSIGAILLGSIIGASGLWTARTASRALLRVRNVAAGKVELSSRRLLRAGGYFAGSLLMLASAGLSALLVHGLTWTAMIVGGLGLLGAVASAGDLLGLWTPRDARRRQGDAAEPE